MNWLVRYGLSGMLSCWHGLRSGENPRPDARVSPSWPVERPAETRKPWRRLLCASLSAKRRMGVCGGQTLLLPFSKPDAPTTCFSGKNQNPSAGAIQSRDVNRQN